MTDDELESLLRRYGVCGPDPQLRHFILRPDGPSMLWGPAAAAAILVAWVAVHASRVEPAPEPVRDAAVAAIAAALGGGDAASAYAEAAVPHVAEQVQPIDLEEPW